MKVLVTGATGSVGRLVVDRLLARGATDVRALTNDPRRAQLPAGVEVVTGTVWQPETLRAALSGVDRLYLPSAPATTRRVVAAARAAGVERIVDLSGEPTTWWGEVAAAVEDGGTGWTHLWPGDFMENTSTWARQISDRGGVAEPWPHATSTPVAMADVAEVAAVALLEDGYLGRALPITGPEALRRTDLLAAIGAALGRELVFERVGRDEAVAALAPVMGAGAAWYVDTILAGSADADPVPTTVVADVTGRPATRFADWARENAASFA
ncbi:SDR family oxidoreductase [Kineococcus sp. SYSU DK003]|uniref:SDR family oxidoreductase n=1 Tax=Kineococcus sp. SYSU DK003 TaxID=3383124 RepID=UPI003D7CDB0F